MSRAAEGRTGRFRWRTPSLVLAGVAAVGAQQVGLYGPVGPLQPAWFPGAEKVQHALGFAVPMFLVLTTSEIHAARGGRALRPLAVAALAGVFVVNAGTQEHMAVSELVQARPGSGRRGDPVDAVADLVGLGIGIGLGYLAFRRLRRGPVAG